MHDLRNCVIFLCCGNEGISGFCDAAQSTQKLRSALALADFYVADHRDADARAVLEAATTGPLGDLARARLAALNTKE